MDNYSNRQVEMQINLKEVLWDLLEQWKAVLVVALLSALLVAGAKYAKDMKAYDAAKAEKTNVVQSGLAVEERIAKLVDSLPEDEKSTVEYLIKQDEWIESEKEYIANSIIMNLNPASQRTLSLGYNIAETDEDNNNLRALANAYASYVSEPEMLEKLAAIIDPGAQHKYISELISTNYGNNTKSDSKNMVTSENDTSVAISISIALPEETDAKMIENVIADSYKKYSSELRDSMGDHSLSLFNVSESYIYNSDVINDRNNILSSIYNLTNNAKNLQTSLSDDQKAVLEKVKAIRKEETESADGAEINEESERMPRPGFSKKYALLGFVLGCMAYAFIYLIWLIVRGRVNYASDIEHYTGSRLLGEIYEKKEHKGLNKLFHSRIVERYRFGEIPEIEKQIAGITSTIETICEHNGLTEISGIVVTDEKETGNNRGKDTLDKIARELNNKNIGIKYIEIADNVEDKTASEAVYPILCVYNDSKVAVLSKLVDLCNTYDNSMLGSVYVKQQ